MAVSYWQSRRSLKASAKSWEDEYHQLLGSHGKLLSEYATLDADRLALAKVNEVVRSVTKSYTLAVEHIDELERQIQEFLPGGHGNGVEGKDGSGAGGLAGQPS